MATSGSPSSRAARSAASPPDVHSTWVGQEVQIGPRCAPVVREIDFRVVDVNGDEGGQMANPGVVRGFVSASAIAFLWALAGCGESEAGDQLAGTVWEVQVNSTDTVVAAYYADGTYSLGSVFLLGIRGTGADVDRGTYHTAGDQLTTVPTSVSCPTHAHRSETVSFQVAGDILTVTQGSGAVTALQRVATDRTSSTGAAIFGCNEGDTFTVHGFEQL